MRWWPYLASLRDLLFDRRHFRSIHTDTTSEQDPRSWPTDGLKNLFFDIDDTLQPHGGAVSLEALDKLNGLMEGHRVILLTNCSEARADKHREAIQGREGIELWPVGKKPDYKWLVGEMKKKGLKPEESAMYGDRPTTDLWMAWKAGFRRRCWVKAYGCSSPRSPALAWIQKFEWRTLET